MVSQGKDDEEDEFNCTHLFIIGAVIVSGFILWNCWNTNRLHDTIRELINKPRMMWGRPPDDSVVYSHDGQ